jgi:hypothetical protein
MQISNIWDVWYCGSPRSLAKKRRLLAVKYTQEATERRGNPFSYKRALVSQNHRKQIEPVPGWAAMAPRPTPCPPAPAFLCSPSVPVPRTAARSAVGTGTRGHVLYPLHQPAAGPQRPTNSTRLDPSATPAGTTTLNYHQRRRLGARRP